MIGYIVTGAALALLAAIMLLIRRRALHEAHALAWIVALSLIAAIGLAPWLLSEMATIIGVRNPPNILLGIAVFSLTCVTIYQQVLLSRTDEKVRKLVLHLALLEADLKASNPSQEPLIDQEEY